LEEQEVEAEPHEHMNEEEFVIEEVADHEEELTEEDQQHEQAGGQEEHITMESVHEFQPAEVEYVTIKDEFETIVTEEDEIEIMDESGAQDEILDGQMIVIPAEGAIDEVIGEEAIELDENEREEHLVGGHGITYTRNQLIHNSLPTAAGRGGCLRGGGLPGGVAGLNASDHGRSSSVCVFRVPEGVPPAVPTQPAHALPRRREALRVRGVWQATEAPAQLQGAHAHPHQCQAAPVQHLRSVLPHYL